MIQGSTAPPVRQARKCLADNRGDLPLTAFFRRRSGSIQMAMIAGAISALAIFVVPLVIGR